MAELTSRARDASANGRGGPDDNGNGGRPDVPVANRAIDPRAVRVRLAAASRLRDEPGLLISPVGEPLRMTNPTVGRGPLGGAAVPARRADVPADRADVPAARAERAVPDDAGGGVLAQRQAVEVDGERADVALRNAGPGRFVLDLDGVPVRVVLEPVAPAEGGVRRREVLVDGFRFEVETESGRIAALRERASRGRAANARTGPLEVKAIIPGKVVSVSVAPGDAVTAGQQLLVVEAMKMQNELRAPRDGTISRVGVAPGVNIEVGDLLVVIS